MTPPDKIEELKGLLEQARRIYRALEMSAGIMRDPRRTGGWEGSERTASAFERQGFAAKELHDALPALLSDLEALQAENERLKGEVERDAVSAVQCMAANWTQDHRDPAERRGFIEGGQSIVDELVDASPGEWLNTDWLTVQEWQAKLNAAEAQLKAAREALERIERHTALLDGMRSILALPYPKARDVRHPVDVIAILARARIIARDACRGSRS